MSAPTRSHTILYNRVSKTHKGSLKHDEITPTWSYERVIMSERISAVSDMSVASTAKVCGSAWERCGSVWERCGSVWERCGSGVGALWERLDAIWIRCRSQPFRFEGSPPNWTLRRRLHFDEVCSRKQSQWISYWELAVWNKLFCRKFNKNRITKLCDGPSNRQLYLHSISVKAHVFCIRCVRARYIIVWVWELDDADIFDIWWSKSCGSAWERVGARGSEHKLKVSNLIQTIFRIFIYTKVNFGWFPNMKKTVEAPEKVVFEYESAGHTKGFLRFYIFTTVRKLSIWWRKMLA